MTSVVSFQLDGVDEALLARAAARLGISPEELAARIVHEQLDEIADQVGEGSPFEGLLGEMN